VLRLLDLSLVWTLSPAWAALLRDAAAAAATEKGEFCKMSGSRD
jgi:hypothetical protein